ncbi:MAG TPA: protein kinase [Polyangium sp.]|nr:protein kinase [Polyangium sp.]
MDSALRGKVALIDSNKPNESVAEIVVVGDVIIEPGTVIEQYEIVRRIGKGGMGVVFLARDTRLARLVAIKILHNHGGSSSPRFFVEARMTARCRHENIVIIHEVGETRGCPYMVLEYVDGKSFRHIIEQESASMTTSRAIELIIPVLRAVVCAHGMGIIHRDLKPENILLRNDGSVKVLDFGISKPVAADAATVSLPHAAHESENVVSTQTGALLGTMPYMSPEQWRFEPLDASTDVWAIGIILFELLTGVHPLAPLSMRQLSTVKDLEIALPSIREYRPNVGELGDVVDRCLKKRARERYPLAVELLDALESIYLAKPSITRTNDESPFAGLSAFQESDSSRFFGRDHDVTTAIGKLRSQELLTITGSSGAGKSSFVRAGVIPAFKRAHQGVDSFVVRPGRKPLVALADILARNGDSETIARTLAMRPGYLGARLREFCKQRGRDHRILLFVDQFEELYTLGIELSERLAFCACLLGVADDASSPLRVIIGIRSDFLERLTEDRAFLAAATAGLLFLPPLTREGLGNALKKPLEAVRHRFEDDTLCDELLDGLGTSKNPLPLLQFTAAQLWETRDKEERLLTRAGYLALGGVAGALSMHADAVVSALSPREQRLARSILVRLVTPERTRAIIQLEELSGLDEDDRVVEQVIQHLAGARLLMVDADDEGAGKTLEIVHELLIDRWGRLRQWLDEDEHDALFLSRLRNAAQQWEKAGETEGLVWRDRSAMEAGQWLERRRVDQKADQPLGLGKREQKYLEAVIGLAARTRRWRRRIAAGIMAGLTLVAIVVTVLAIRAKNQAIRADEQAARADKQAQQAQEEARLARNATRMAAAREASDDLTTMLALVREVEGPGVPRGWHDLALKSLGIGACSAICTHPLPLTKAVWSPDEKRIVTSLDVGTMWVWNADGMGQPLILRGHNEGFASEGVAAMVWSPDGRRLATASIDMTVRVWDMEGSKAPIILRGHTDSVWSVNWSPDGARIVSASEDKTARIWPADGRGESLVLRGHERGVNSAIFAPDGEHVVTTSSDKTARIWNADGQGEPTILRGSNDIDEATPVTPGGAHINDVAVFSPDGKRFITWGISNVARVWNADGSGTPIELRGHKRVILAAAWSSDSQRIVTASYDTTARVWFADGHGEATIFQGHEEAINDVAFSPDNKLVATAGWDSSVRIFSVNGDRPPLVLRHRARVLSVRFSADGNRIATASWDSTLRVWNIAGVIAPAIRQVHAVRVYSAMWSPDGKRIVTTSSDQTARIWPADGHGESIVLRGHEKRIYFGAFSPDGKRIVTASADKTARVWNADDGQPLLIFRDHDDEVNNAIFSPDGKHVLSVSIDKTLRLWNADGTGEALVFRGHEAAVSSATWSHDGTRFVSGSEDFTARVWNADGQGEPVVLRGHTNFVRWAAFSPDDQRIVTAGYDDTVRIWNADGTGEPIVLRPFDGGVNWAGWSADGQRIFTADQDKLLRMWNADGTGESIILHRSPGWLKTSDLSPDGKKLVVPAWDGTIAILSDLERLSGPNDPRLWSATTYCLPIAERVKRLGVSEDIAKVDQDACLRRVVEAQNAGLH